MQSYTGKSTKKKAIKRMEKLTKNDKFLLGCVIICRNIARLIDYTAGQLNPGKSSRRLGSS